MMFHPLEAWVVAKSHGSWHLAMLPDVVNQSILAINFVGKTSDKKVNCGSL